ncbi:MAG: PD-(D/E)XK nuclease family protein [Acidobacteria bacterium]|nr:PD-(D/E)XK nuclease family protein [Acidobacteriota bacterium]
MMRSIGVRDVREELYRAAGGSSGAGSGKPSTFLLGTWFHESFAALVGADPRYSLETALAETRGGVAEQALALKRHVFRRLIGPRLPRHHSHLADATEELMGFWKAVDDLCHWLAEIRLEAAGGRERLRIVSEEALSWELREPGWTDAVRVSGQADAVFCRPQQAPWCVVELKLGRGQPEADLGQACLYYLMLAAKRDRRSQRGSLALVSFTPRRQVHVFAPEELAPALPRLKALIGRLAGVVPHVQPPVAVDKAQPSAPKDDRYADLARQLLKVFEEFGAPATLSGTVIAGPAFLRFPLEPRRGVKIAKVQGTAIEVQARLKLDAPPFITLDRGQLVVDLQRPDRQVLTLSQFRDQLPQRDPLQGNARVPIGVDLENRLHCADLAEALHAHVLVAGTTGSGKSEWLRAALSGLLLTNTPETLRLVLIDPKRQAFSELAYSPFLRDGSSLVFPDERDVTEVLDDLIEEMEERYRQMQAAKADNLAELVRRARLPVPRIVCVCDEYADLVSRGRQERKAVEERILRLGQKARASGIHLIVATQQPSREIIKGALDSNMPCRVGLKMQKAIDSRMLLETSGAEKLLGNGDLLFRDIGPPRRLQGLRVPPEVRAELFSGRK